MNVEQMFQALNDYIGNAKNPEQMIDDPEMDMIIGNSDFDKVRDEFFRKPYMPHVIYHVAKAKCIDPVSPDITSYYKYTDRQILSYLHKVLNDNLIPFYMTAVAAYIHTMPEKIAQDVLDTLNVIPEGIWIPYLLSICVENRFENQRLVKRLFQLLEETNVEFEFKDILEVKDGETELTILCDGHYYDNCRTIQNNHLWSLSRMSALSVCGENRMEPVNSWHVEMNDRTVQYYRPKMFLAKIKAKDVKLIFDMDQSCLIDSVRQNAVLVDGGIYDVVEITPRDIEVANVISIMISDEPKYIDDEQKRIMDALEVCVKEDNLIDEQAKNFYDQMKRYTQRYKLPEKLEDYEGFGEIKTVNQMLELIRTTDYYTRKEAMNLAKSFFKDKNRRWFHIDDPFYGDCEIDGGYIFDVLMCCSETRKFVIRKGKFRKAKEDFKIYYEAGDSSDTMFPICFDLNSKSE